MSAKVCLYFAFFLEICGPLGIIHAYGQRLSTPNSNCIPGRPVALKIRNPLEVTPHAYPWTVAIEYWNEVRCGGTLIHPEWVITAAHCFPPSRFDGSGEIPKVTLKLGRHNLDACETSAQETVAAEIRRHRQFNDSTFAYDFALVKLKQPAVMTNQVRTLDLPSNCVRGDLPARRRVPYILDGCDKAVVAGWGLDERDRSSPVLQQFHLTIQHSSKCQRYFGANFIPSPTVFCGEGNNGSDACPGDSGGPAMCQDSDGSFQLIGIVSFGGACTSRHSRARFGGYARVCEVMPWIRYVTRLWRTATTVTPAPPLAPTRCSDVFPIANGRLEAGNTEHGAVRNVACNNGYERRGPNIVVCDYGQWRPNTSITCQPKFCPVPVRDKGYVTFNGRRAYGDLPRNSKIKYHCDSTLVLKQNYTSFCSRRGWFPPPPGNCTCSDSELPHIANGSLEKPRDTWLVVCHRSYSFSGRRRAVRCTPQGWRAPRGHCMTACASVEFKCNSGHCVPLEYQCDGVDDCDDRSDEAGCPDYDYYN